MAAQNHYNPRLGPRRTTPPGAPENSLRIKTNNHPHPLKTEPLKTENSPTSAPPSPLSPAPAFLTTHWTRVLAARGDSTLAGDALRELCADYYAPVTAFLQRSPGLGLGFPAGSSSATGRDSSGNGIPDGNADAARETAHSFFEWVLSRDPFASADRQRGRFRSYLLGALKHWLANERGRRQTLKRGGHIPHLPLTDPTDTSPGLDPPDETLLPPDREFDRQWALHILRRALEELETEFTRTGEARRFTLLKPFLTGEAHHGALATLAAAEGWPESTARSHLHRLRRRFRQAVKRQITPTLAPASASHSGSSPGPGSAAAAPGNSPAAPSPATDFEAETTDEMAILMAALTGT